MSGQDGIARHHDNFAGIHADSYHLPGQLAQHLL